MGNLGGLGEGLGGLGGHVGSKTGPRAQKSFRGPPLDPQVGGQNSPKIGPKPIENAIVFLIDSGGDFQSILAPTWLQLGGQNPSKMEPSWVQNRCKLEYSFGSYFWKDVGYIFYGFGTQVKIGQVAKSVQNMLCF